MNIIKENLKEVTSNNPSELVVFEKGSNKLKRIKKENFNGYKSYVALLTQTGTNAPIDTVLQNNIGNLSWEYVGVGNYKINGTNLFGESKTVVFTTPFYDNAEETNCYVYFKLATNDSVEIFVYNDVVSGYHNNTLNNTPIEIRVYP